MSAILLTKGPVSVNEAVRRWGPKRFRHYKKSHFLEASRDLQTANLGSLTHIKSTYTTHDVFIKRAPSEIGDGLADNRDLCTLDEYTSRFYMTPAACLSKGLLDELIARELVKSDDIR